MLIRSKNVWYADGFRPADLVISEGKIEAVYPYGKGEGKLCQPDEVRDYGTLRILPGFIDITPTALMVTIQTTGILKA